MTWHRDDDTTEEQRKAYAEHEAARFKREVGSGNESAMLAYTVVASFLLVSFGLNLCIETYKLITWTPETESQKKDKDFEILVLIVSWLLYIGFFFLADWLVFGLVL
jgi:hypothetical protein